MSANQSDDSSEDSDSDTSSGAQLEEERALRSGTGRRPPDDGDGSDDDDDDDDDHDKPGSNRHNSKNEKMHVRANSSGQKAEVPALSVRSTQDRGKASPSDKEENEASISGEEAHVTAERITLSRDSCRPWSPARQRPYTTQTRLAQIFDASYVCSDDGRTWRCDVFTFLIHEKLCVIVCIYPSVSCPNMYVCVCVRVVSVSVSVFVSGLCVCVCVRLYIYIYIYIYIFMYKCTHTHIHTFICTYIMYIYNLCVCVCVCVCVTRISLQQISG
jgi:hypothetical protein